MYSVTVRDHIMIAHSLDDEVFGPARNLHGATYIVDAEFKRRDLDRHNVVIDIGLASRILRDVCASLHFQNLDEKQEWRGVLTTTEFLARHIHDSIWEHIENRFQGIIKVTLYESHLAWASYEGRKSD